MGNDSKEGIMPSRFDFVYSEPETLAQQIQEYKNKNPHNYKHFVDFNITGKVIRKSVTEVEIMKRKIQVMDALLKIILRLVQESKRNKLGYVGEQRLINERIVSEKSIRQRMNQIKVLFRDSIQDNIIEIKRNKIKQKAYRLSIYPDLIKYNIENLKNSADSKIQKIADKLSTQQMDN